MGPGFDYSEYIQFIELKNNFSYIPCGLSTCLRELLYGFICMAIYVPFTKQFPIELCGTDEFGNYSFLYKFFFYNVSMTLVRFRYYVAWSFNNSAYAASGIF